MVDADGVVELGAMLACSGAVKAAVAALSRTVDVGRALEKAVKMIKEITSFIVVSGFDSEFPNLRR